MTDFFVTLLDMSVVSALVICVVLLMRLILRKAPKWVVCLLWALVGLRLICPFTFQTPLSLIPQSQPVSQGIEWYEETYSPRVSFHEEIENDNSEFISEFENNATKSEAAESPVSVMQIAAVVWLCGAGVMIAISLISYVRLRLKVRVSVELCGNVRICDDIDTPFVLGLIRPKIYLPSNLSTQQAEIVTSHEKAHIKRLDHIWKPLGYMILTIHWFNPLVWLAYVLLCRDIESACDQKVLKDMSLESKKEYSNVLLACSVPRYMVTACPVAFGETGVKQRVKSVLSFKKPAVWIIIVSIVACVAVAVAFATNPIVSDEVTEAVSFKEFVNKTIVSKYKDFYEKDEFVTAGHYVISQKTENNVIKLYGNAMRLVYECDEYGIRQTSGATNPIYIEAEKKDGGYKLLEYWEPEDGEGYYQSITDKFGEELAGEAIFADIHLGAVQEECDKNAEEYFKSKMDITVGQFEYQRARVKKVYEDKLLITVNEEGASESEDVYIYLDPENNQIFMPEDVLNITYIYERPGGDASLLIKRATYISRYIIPYGGSKSDDFIRVYDYDGQWKDAVVYVTDEKADKIEVYRYMDGGTKLKPYVALDRENSAFTLVYMSDVPVVITGKYSIHDNRLYLYEDTDVYLRTVAFEINEDENLTFTNELIEGKGNIQFSFSQIFPDGAVFERGFTRGAH